MSDAREIRHYERKNSPIKCRPAKQRFLATALVYGLRITNFRGGDAYVLVMSVVNEWAPTRTRLSAFQFYIIRGIYRRLA